MDSVLARTWAEQRSGADRANGGLVACGCHPGRGGSPPALDGNIINITMDPELRRRAGHYEILGETHAKYEFFHQGWNPYSRFLDVDKVDLILRRTKNGLPMYREVQAKFGKLYTVTGSNKRMERTRKTRRSS